MDSAMMLRIVAIQRNAHINGPIPGMRNSGETNAPGGVHASGAIFGIS